MTDLNVPTTVSDRTMSTASAVRIQGTVSDPPPAFQHLGPGSFLRGEAVGRDEHGRYLLRTDHGLLAINSKVPIPIGSDVTVQVRQASADLLVIVMRIDPPASRGQAETMPVPAGTGGGNARESSTPAPAAGQAASPRAETGAGVRLAQAGDVVALGQTLRAIVQAPATGAGGAEGAAAKAGPPVPPVGSVLILRVVEISPPSGSVPASPAGRLGNPAASSHRPPSGQAVGAPAPAQSAEAGKAAASSTASGAGQAGRSSLSALASRLAAVLPGSAPHAPSPDGSPSTPSYGRLPTAATGIGVAGPWTTGATGTIRVTAGVDAVSRPSAGAGHEDEAATQSRILRFTAVANGAAKGGQPLLASPLGLLRLELTQPLAAGTQITLELNGEDLRLGDVRQPASPWTALEESYRLLAAQGPSPALSALGAQLPAAGSKLAAGLLWFLSGLGASGAGRGGIRPDAAVNEALERAGRRDLASRLTQEFAQGARTVEGLGGEWRGLSIPVLVGESFETLRFFIRRQGGDDGTAERDADDEATRFLLEVQFGRLGDLQLDGLARRRRLDLIVRSRSPLPEAMREDISAIFYDSLEAAGLAGRLTFAAAASWHALTAELSSATAGSDVTA